MTRDADPTRRRFVAAGGTVLGTALAGCSGTSGGGSDATATDATTDEQDTDSPTDAGSDETTATDAAASYTASIAPVGEVTFESPPERIFAITTHHADMALSLGRGDDLTAVYAPAYNDSLLSAFAARLDGVSVDWADLYDSWNPSKERLYALDSDLHLADPANVLAMDAWAEDDVAEVRDEIAPWFGNTLSDRYRDPPAAYAERYEHYDLWGIFERVAAALDERERYSALADVRAALLDTVEADLPPEGDRPTVAMMLPSTAEDSQYWPYDVTADGFFAAHTRPLGARDAFDGMDGVGDADPLDYEALLEADPDVIFVLGGVVDTYDMPAIRERFRSDPVAGDVTAVQEGRVYAQGTRHQGPLLNLFQLEMTAKQLYPDRFGEWPTYESGPYPELSDDVRLLDYDRVAEVVRGDFESD
ncbi:ABC transporter substrate-binding protein [Halomicrobium salinisoli]|uniref:ABC transporter substrate-binding protein n=1 Tax=Halomicrobium salinisoli TaxID=2878391 RepID=UPI001CF05AED|nr:ABC transporter substrate-binding protein [Halomicrobium salinisoli]